MNYRHLRRFGRLAAVVAICCGSGIVIAGEVIEQIVVKVNGEILTKTDLENRQVQALRQMGQQIDPKQDPSDTQLRQMLDQVTPPLMVSLIDEMLLVQRGRELGYRMADDQFASIIDSIKKDNKIDSEEAFQAALKQENMTMAELRRTLERQMIVSRVQQNEVMSRVAVDEEEARAYYQSHMNEFTSPRSVTLREIFVNVPGDGKTVNVGLDEEARAKIEGIRARALGGENFETLATEVSDAPSKANGGLIGPLSVNDLSPDMQRLIEGMKPGEITEPLRSPRGYQILKLETATAAETTPFEEAREQISNRVVTDKRRQEFEKYVEKLRTQAIIEWKNADLRKAYEKGLEAAHTES
ncbi:MAG: peptidyl-prolyl cis-trans isomerase [Vicinamibacterales bacterium]